MSTGNSSSSNLRQTLSWYNQFASIGGFVQARESKNWVSKAFWSALFIVGLVFTCFNVVNCIKDYLANRTFSSQKFQLVGSRGTQEFPAGTICNSNRVHCGHLHEVTTECQKVRTQRPKNLPNFCSKLRFPAQKNQKLKCLIFTPIY